GRGRQRDGGYERHEDCEFRLSHGLSPLDQLTVNETLVRGHAAVGSLAAMNSRRALFTSSECVQPMLCGPPSTGTSVQSAISAGRRAAVDSKGRIRSSVRCTRSTVTSIFDTSPRKSVRQVSTNA